MVGKELVAAKPSAPFNLREESFKVALRDAWNKGHVYVERRLVGKKPIFFCMLCSAKCFNDTVLWDHLRGNNHSKKRAFAEATLYGDLPWPFSDGVRFFHHIPPGKHKGQESWHPRIAYSQDDQQSSNSNSCTALLADGHSRGSNPVYDDANCGGLELVESVGMPLRSKGRVCKSVTPKIDVGFLEIHDVLVEEKPSTLTLRHLGYGHTSSRIFEDDKLQKTICKMWCAWLGEGDSNDNDVLLTAPECDFGVVVLSYRHDLGRKSNTDDQHLLLSSGLDPEIEDADGRVKRIKSFSDTEIRPWGSNEQADSSGEDSPRSNGLNKKNLMSKDDQLHGTRSVSKKEIRQGLRKKKLIAAERTCDLCMDTMLPGKDVAALLNRKTGKLVCSSRNFNGAYHLFHISCLIHWIILCEYALYYEQPAKARTVRRKARRTSDRHITSILCPECQGTGTNIKGKQLETISICPNEVFFFKLRAHQSYKGWKKDPEILQKCSTGLRIICEKTPLVKGPPPEKLLHFYRAEV